MPQLVLNPSDSGGSGAGCSYHLSAASCPRAARLDVETRAPDTVLTDETLCRDAGTLFHALADMYHSGRGLAEDIVLPAGLGYESAAAEAMRMFREYALRYPPDAWGAVLATELQLPRKDREEEDSKALEQAVGITPFTLRIDLVTEVKEEHVPKIRARTGLELEPGPYLVDHKTKHRKDANMHLAFAHSLQFNSYQVGYEAVLGVRPKGMIANVVIGHKKMTDDSFCAVLVSPPNETWRTKIIPKFLRTAQVLAPTDFANLLSCFRFGVCKHLLSGACELY